MCVYTTPPFFCILTKTINMPPTFKNLIIWAKRRPPKL